MAFPSSTYEEYLRKTIIETLNMTSEPLIVKSLTQFADYLINPSITHKNFLVLQDFLDRENLKPFKELSLKDELFQDTLKNIH